MAENDPVWSYGETKISLGPVTSITEPEWSYGESYLIGEELVVILVGLKLTGAIIR